MTNVVSIHIHVLKTMNSLISLKHDAMLTAVLALVSTNIAFCKFAYSDASERRMQTAR